MSPHLAARVRVGVLLVVGLLAQTALGADLRVGGVAPDFMVLLAISGGITGGAAAGAWVGFWAGLGTDLFLTGTPLGLSALTCCLVGAVVGHLRAGVVSESRLLVPVLALAATAAEVLLFVGLGEVMGQDQLMGAGARWVIRVALVEGLWSAVLALPVVALYRRAARGSVGADTLGSTRPERLTTR